MRYLILIAAFCVPSISFAANYLCLPEITVGWTNNENPNDIRIIEPQNKWLLQPIERVEMAFMGSDTPEEVNYSVKILGQDKVYGYCRIEDELFGKCYEFYWPKDKSQPVLDNKLSDYNIFYLEQMRDEKWAYVFSDTGNLTHYAIDGVASYNTPKLALERGTCEAF